MKIASFVRHGRPGFGPVSAGLVTDVSTRLGSLAAVLAHADFAARIAAATEDAPQHALADVTLVSPVPQPNRIICVGLNYKTHIAEMGREPGEHPAIFMRYPDSIVGHGQPIERARVSEQYDFEGELAFIIGIGGRHVAAADAMASVAGFTAFNDGSIRDWQRHTQQFGPGKNFYHSGACGPWLVTTDELADIGAQTLTTRLNGQVMQHARLDDLLFGVPALVAYLSTIFPLLPGDIIATGTTGGVGAARKPPVWMKPGDTVAIEISGIGTLENTVVDET
jgi:2-keto-4-pentenoate hydratase/2-oxohepta-3-ene-1,7-dioic acid hydratase in catechol pathway